MRTEFSWETEHGNEKHIPSFPHVLQWPFTEEMKSDVGVNVQKNAIQEILVSVLYFWMMWYVGLHIYTMEP